MGRGVKGRNGCNFERVGGWLEEEGMGVNFEGVGGWVGRGRGKEGGGKEWVQYLRERVDGWSMGEGMGGIFEVGEWVGGCGGWGKEWV